MGPREWNSNFHDLTLTCPFSSFRNHAFLPLDWIFFSHFRNPFPPSFLAHFPFSFLETMPSWIPKVSCFSWSKHFLHLHVLCMPFWLVGFVIISIFFYIYGHFLIFPYHPISMKTHWIYKASFAPLINVTHPLGPKINIFIIENN